MVISTTKWEAIDIIIHINNNILNINIFDNTFSRLQLTIKMIRLQSH